MIVWGDAPTWLAVAAAIGAAYKVDAADRHKQHYALLPDFGVAFDVYPPALTLIFRKPREITMLNPVTVCIRDDYRRIASPGSLQSQEDLDKVVWGPYCFKHGVDLVSSDGRCYGPTHMAMLDRLQIPLEKSRPPSWCDREWWEEEWVGADLRLLIMSNSRRNPKRSELWYSYADITTSL